MEIKWTNCADAMPPDNDDEIIYNNTITNKFYHGTASWFRFTQSTTDIYIYIQMVRLHTRKMGEAEQMNQQCGNCNNEKPNFTEDDLDACWPAYKTYLIEILNKEYMLESAIEDLQSLIGSRFDPRGERK